ncbi:MAG: peptide chain release factor N(5)-glutamine methyltransferase [Bacteroidetes bacterium HGW-Bacteroidetes-2]|nr:MAG: peptide chain release factor N(5)-glutamine methyltransferase [Bacteroidetes bacterium HGW-Bacteroidetes-2]
MHLKSYKNFLKEQLKFLYHKEEIDSFFLTLSQHYLKWNRAEAVLNQEKELPLKVEYHLQTALRKLKNQIPIQYIVGETEFYSLTFQVNPSVLIPRPETEELVDWILESQKEVSLNIQSSSKTHISNQQQIAILDIGTGSGCIAIALAKNLPNAMVSAFDVSKEALVTARKNAQNNEVKITFLEMDILKSTDLGSKWDIIVSNPPYIKEEEKSKMFSNVLDNEPHLALFVPDVDALLFYKKITILAKKHLKVGGMLYFEINEAHGINVLSLLENEGFTNLELRKDFYGKDRMVLGKF